MKISEKIFTVSMAYLSILPIVGCVTNDTVPMALDRTLNVKTSVTDLGDDSIRIDMKGVGLMNRAGAIESFTRKADKIWGGMPYNYKFDIEKITTPQSQSDFYDNLMPFIYANYGVYAGLYVLSDELQNQEVLKITGITRKIQKVKLDRTKRVFVLKPEDQVFKKKVHIGSGENLAVASAQVLRNYFDRVDVVDIPSESGINLYINIFRWQDRHPLGGKEDIVTAEYVFHDANSNLVIVEFLLIAKEPFFHMKQGVKPEDFIEPALQSRIEQFFEI